MRPYVAKVCALAGREGGKHPSGAYERYYVTRHGGEHIVHDRMQEVRGDPLTRTFRSAAAAEEARASLEARYGNRPSWAASRGTVRNPDVPETIHPAPPPMPPQSRSRSATTRSRRNRERGEGRYPSASAAVERPESTSGFKVYGSRPLTDVDRTNITQLGVLLGANKITVRTDDTRTQVQVMAGGDYGGSSRSVKFTMEEFASGKAATLDYVEFHTPVSPKVARDVLGQTLKTIQDAGADKLSVQAGLSDGGYLWARLGFKINPESRMGIERSVTRNVEEALVQRPERGEKAPRLTLAQADRIRAVVRSPADDMMQQLADLKDGQIKLGRIALKNTGWKGTGRLSSPVMTARINHFLGKR
jgi:hypothetical protein